MNPSLGRRLFFGMVAGIAFTVGAVIVCGLAMGMMWLCENIAKLGNLAMPVTAFGMIFLSAFLCGAIPDWR